MGSPTVVHGSRQKEKERERGVIALGATAEFSRSRTERACHGKDTYSRASASE